MASTAHPTPVPAPVRHAVTLWLAVVALQVVSAVVGVFASDPRSRMFDPASPFDGTDALGVGFLVVVVAVLVLVVYRMRAGRNWARIVLLVFGVLGALGLRHIADPVPDTVELVLRIVGTGSVVLGVAAVVLTFRPEATPHFATSTG